MPEQEYTPGPWLAVGMGSEGYNIYPKENFEKPLSEHKFKGAIAYVRGGDWQTLRANAHLIETAPELLEALTQLVNYFDGDEPLMQKAREVVAKAIGKAKS